MRTTRHPILFGLALTAGLAGAGLAFAQNEPAQDRDMMQGGMMHGNMMGQMSAMMEKCNTMMDRMMEQKDAGQQG